MGLFDQLKDGVLGVFGGPQDPRVALGTGQKEAITMAGLTTLASPDEDALQALAQGAIAGREHRMALQERAHALGVQAELGEFLGQAGFDREGLTSSFMKALELGDIDTAKSIGEVLKSLPKPIGPEELQFINDDILMPDGSVRAQTSVFGRTSGRLRDTIDRGEVLVNDPSIYEPSSIKTVDDPNSPTGRSIGGIIKDTGEFVTFAHAPAGSAGGGGPFRPEQALVESAERDLDAMFNPDANLSGVGTQFLGRLANDPSLVGDLANQVQGDVQPEAQLALQAQGRVLAHVVRVMSGAQMTEPEYQRYRTAFAIRGGEQGAASDNKEAALRFLFSRLKETNGVVTDPRTGERLGKDAVVNIFLQADAIQAGNGFAPSTGTGEADFSGVPIRR